MALPRLQASDVVLEGQNFRFELRDANDQYDRIPIMFRELADQKVTVMVGATTVQLEAAKAATQSIPIVFYTGVDPVESGFVASLNKPGGNLTGMFNLNSMMTGKRVEVLRELVPSLKKFAFLTNPRDLRLGKVETREAQAAADSLASFHTGWALFGHRAFGECPLCRSKADLIRSSADVAF